jgi:hypothetical protein
MSFATIVDRVRGEFMEMPDLELTMPQAIRLWSLGADDCRYVIEALVDAGFLGWTAKRTIVRRGGDPLGSRKSRLTAISVAARPQSHKSVAHE